MENSIRVEDILSLYTQNVAVTIAEKFTTNYQAFDSAKDVPDELKRCRVVHISPRSVIPYGPDGITIWCETTTIQAHWEIYRPDEKLPVDITVEVFHGVDEFFDDLHERIAYDDVYLDCDNHDITIFWDGRNQLYRELTLLTDGDTVIYGKYGHRCDQWNQMVDDHLSKVDDTKRFFKNCWYNPTGRTQAQHIVIFQKKIYPEITLEMLETAYMETLGVSLRHVKSKNLTDMLSYYSSDELGILASHITLV